jgi:hypothetical protein
VSEVANSLEQEVLEAEAVEREAFEARFPPKNFLPVARALKIRDQAVFARLVQSLRNEFYFFYMDCHSKWPSRGTEMERLRELREAANLLASADLWLPSKPLGEDEEEQFLATTKRLATFWDAELTKLEAAPSAAGRPSHDEFHELIIGLIRTYQRISRKRATKPSTRFNKPGYHSDFYQFAIAGWRCLRDHLPEARHLIPSSERALAEALRKHWPKKRTAGYKLILHTPR